MLVYAFVLCMSAGSFLVFFLFFHPCVLCVSLFLCSSSISQMLYISTEWIQSLNVIISHNVLLILLPVCLKLYALCMY